MRLKPIERTDIFVKYRSSPYSRPNESCAHITITLFLTYLLSAVLSDMQLFIQAVHIMTFLPRCICIAMRILSVCLSVSPSVTRVIPDKTEERSVQIFTPYERTCSLVF